MSPRIREAWAMTFIVVASMALFATYQVYRTIRLSGFDLAVVVAIYAFFGLATALGVAAAWWRIYRDRKDRRN